MKLREYLKKFEGLDPEMEVFDQHPDYFTIDKVDGNCFRIVYVEDPSENSCEYGWEPGYPFNKKVVKLL